MDSLAKETSQLQLSPTPFGKAMLKDFLIDPVYHNMNNGSFGTIPRHIQAVLRSYQDQAEARPDPFIRWTYRDRLKESRQAIADLLNAPLSCTVFVSNTTVGINTVLRNLAWAPDGLDEILYFSTVYGGCATTIDYVVDTRAGLVSSRGITLAYPLEDDEIVALFHETVAKSRAEGKRPKICLFDVVSSLPGIAFPYQAMTAACRELGIMSLVDGAHGVGMVPLDLAATDPDFFVSNCHKWLHVPRACAVFYVPERNQHLIASTVPTSHGYVARSGVKRHNPLPVGDESPFVRAFNFVGTLDNSPNLCVKHAIEWRKSIGGEDKIQEYLWTLAKEGGKKVAAALGTFILDNKSGTLTKCAMVNVALPIVTSAVDVGTASVAPDGTVTVPEKEVSVVVNWMLRALVDEYLTFVALFWHQGRWYIRISAQIFLDETDFEWLGITMKELCQRVRNQEYKAKAEEATI
ncbi:pyridoxal phosphate-dependent transferase [Colletotrichum navitas]|uniref:Pyridoxal phosphate-dependent transferase n=1 Tax=Colletotrichum navitas TaxID=681940 RepID=A0AAD8UZV3_9PEZI|nr:pyridoxal phosphate-dependent transferase [Colletotrichum navitas]KAK1573598.1 pyridoxal phosphate-dependent transferase [Colletotrichum navitas]